MKMLIAYVAALVALGALDAVWLTLTKPFYMSKIGHLFGDQVVWWAVALFYVLYAAGVVYFAASGADTLSQAVVRGAFLGLVAYATYDLVNLATLKDWPIAFVLVDVGWGMVITAAASAAAFSLL